MYDFDQFVDRRGTTSIKWNFQNSFGQQNGLLSFWIADTDFPTAPAVVDALKSAASTLCSAMPPPFPPPSKPFRAGGNAATAGSPIPIGCS